MRNGSEADASPGRAPGLAPSLAERALAAVRQGRRPRAAPVRVPGGYAPALLLLAAIPAAVAGGAALLAGADARDNAVAARRLADRTVAVERGIAVRAAHAAAARAFTRPTVTDLVVRMARALPAGARLQRLGVAADATIEAAIDCPDPDALRTALAADPVLATLRPLSQSASAEAGVRVTLASRLP